MPKRLSFRAHFGLIAVTSTVAIGVALLSGGVLLYEYESLVARIEAEEFEEVQKWSTAVKDLAQAHDGFVWMVSNLREGADEQEIYLKGKKQLGDLDKLMASISVNGSMPPLEAAAPGDRAPDLAAEFAVYRRSVVTAVEMLTVNPALADRYLARSALSINSLNRALANTLESRQQIVGDSIRSKVAATQRFWWQIMSGVTILSILLLGLIGRLTGALRQAFEFIQFSLAGLARGDTTPVLSPATGEAEYQSVVSSLARFREALVEREFAQSQMRAIFENILEAVIVIDERGLIVQTNPVAGRIFGYAQNEMVGKNIKLIVPAEHAARHDGYLARYFETGEAKIVGNVRFMQGLRKDGTLIEIQLAVNEFKIGNSRFFAGVITDITERIETEKALRKARDAALHAASAKADFLANMSHEIRTPMNAILGMAQLLDGDLLDARQRAQCTRILLGASQTLITLLNDVLDLSKVEAGNLVLNPEPVSPLQLIRETCDLFKESAQLKGIGLEHPDESAAGCWVQADPVRVRQMLSNLVGNAIKFTSHGRVHVTFNQVESDAERCILEFAVIDTGVGIAPGEMSHLFERYSQLNRPDAREAGGSGLGLSLVREFARKMGGDVGVSSEIGKGSRFWFRIAVPLASAPANAAAGGGDDVVGATMELLAGCGATRKVLIAEDTPANRFFLVMALKRMGVATEEAEDGREAVDAVTSGARFDCIFMDMRMPFLDGDGAARRIRAWEAEHDLPRTPIIAVTANAYKEDRELCISAGMDDFLAKPVKVRDLKALLERWLQSPQQ